MKKLIRSIVLAALLVAIVCTFTACGGVSVDLIEFVDVSFTGVDGNGNAACNMDGVALEKALVGDTDGQISAEEGKKLLEIVPFEFSINYKLDKSSGLSNGDKVTVSVSYNEEAAKELKIKVKGSSKTFTVEGLKDPIPVDPFDPSVFNTDNGVSVKIEGISPVASVSLSNNCNSSLDQSRVKYSVDKTWEVCNGDVLTITAELSKADMDEGYFLTSTETTITVSGLNSYITDISMLKAQDVAALQQKAQEQFKNTARSNLQLRFKVYDYGGMRLNLNDEQIGELRLADKGFTSYGGEYVVFPFLVDLYDLEFDWWENKYYDPALVKTLSDCGCYFTFKNLVLDADGNLIQDGSLEMEMSGVFPDNQIMYKEVYQVHSNNDMTENNFNK